jgi:anti-anti-sigma regulatory factor
MNDLTVTTRQHSARTVVTVVGEMDLDSCPALEEATLDHPPRWQDLAP